MEDNDAGRANTTPEPPSAEGVHKGGTQRRLTRRSFVGGAATGALTLERNWTGSVTVDAPWVDDVQGSWSRGCPGYLPPGVLLSFGPAIREPFGLVHWAGTEHSVSWNTYVEGAVRSAEAVASEVLAAL